MVLLVVTVVAGALAAWWMLTAGRAANEGFDITDEGYYLLSYRWWDQNPLALTGVQYVYGPVFELLGRDIVRLRLFRLLTIVVVHLLFGYSFMRWLRGRRPGAAPTTLWELAGTAVILAAGGMFYAWMPQSPGYNDVVLLGALLLVALVLAMATAVDRGRRVPFWLPTAAGVLIGPMVLAKWSSVVVIGLIVVAAVVVPAAQGLRAVARSIGFALAGLVLTTVVVQLFVVRLGEAIPGIVTVNKFIAGTSYSPADLLRIYWTTAVDLLGRTLRDHGLLLVAAVVAVIARGRRAQIAAGVLVLVALILSVRNVVVDDGAVGGSIHVYSYPATLLAAVLVAVAVAAAVLIGGRLGVTAGSRLGRENLRGWVVLALLLVVPMVVSFGTNNPLFVIGLGTFASWAAVMIAVVTGVRPAPVAARLTVGVVAMASVAAVASIAYSGTFVYPYRSFEHSQLTAPATPAPLRGLYLRPEDARNYAELQSRLEPYLRPAGRPILAFDKMAGLVLMLQGRPVGEAWVAPKERQRTASGIEEACRTGQPWSPGRPPVILLNRRISEVEIAALHACALDFAADYELLAPPGQTMQLQVYVPRDERATTTP
ncbi:hypothetical protein E1218_01640 [Kribbella turkmenica]|uniref:Uncharacterized protein n=1 Tax=Kribbella turkmenica TaxID=2530375 RepID=A0A4V2YHA4_9ACTN|nr:hypothetical protein [Kribbella turkmenica]TDD30287.1 hypothetical protein E1218_01640 [Kribbella turkmenica]